jgi:hypothetical protein
VCALESSSVLVVDPQGAVRTESGVRLQILFGWGSLKLVSAVYWAGVAADHPRSPIVGGWYGGGSHQVLLMYHFYMYCM